jgi:hypothetical protein
MRQAPSVAGWSGAVAVEARRRVEWLYGVQVRGLWLWLLVILGGIAPDVAGR